MRLTKAQREQLRGMFGGLCAYCGCALPDRWHADHVEPVLRDQWRGGPPLRPENNHLGNFFPACPQCNISKGRMSVEDWRGWLAGHVSSLNRHHSIYRIAKAYGLVAETNVPVSFHFERAALSESQP